MDGPVAIRYPRGPVPATPDLPVEPLPVGRWEELRKGSDAVVFAVGRMVVGLAIALARPSDFDRYECALHIRRRAALDPQALAEGLRKFAEWQRSASQPEDRFGRA